MFRDKLKYSLLSVSLVFGIVYTSNSFAISKEEIDSYMKKNGFPDSDYPYYEKANGCGSKDDPHLIRDNWFGVHFTNDCYRHDNCYMTIGKSQSECDIQLGKDMSYSCNAQLHGLQNVRIPACKAAAATYLTGVPLASKLLGLYNESQRKQKIYNAKALNLSASINNGDLNFDAGFYLISYDDLRNAFGTDITAAKRHWQTYGLKEGRRSSTLFDVRYYLNKYPDLIKSFWK